MGNHKTYSYGEWQNHVWDHREFEFLDDPDTDDVAHLASSVAEAIGERQEIYQDFLATDYWEKVRSIVLNRAGGRCDGCGRPSTRLEVHHKRYPKRGTEHLNQHLLEALCRSCHDASH